MSGTKLSEMIKESLESIHTIADSNTVMGEPIETNNGTVIIPVSKISVGFASGGLDYVSKKCENSTDKQQGAKTQSNDLKAPCFGGGGGTGVSVTPICFLVVTAEGKVEMLNVDSSSCVPPVVGTINSVSTFADKLPDIVERIKKVFAKKQTEKILDDDILNDELSELKK